MPHMQVKTSPAQTGENLRRVADILSAADVNIDGIGPDFEAPHIRTVVDHDSWDAAWAALDAAGLKPTACRAVEVALDNTSGRLKVALEHLARRGCSVESILVLAAHDQSDRVRVSIGVGDCIPDDWEDVSHAIAEAIEAEATD